MFENRDGFEDRDGNLVSADLDCVTPGTIWLWNKENDRCYICERLGLGGGNTLADVKERCDNYWWVKNKDGTETKRPPKCELCHVMKDRGAPCGVGTAMYETCIRVRAYGPMQICWKPVSKAMFEFQVNRSIAEAFRITQTEENKP